MLERRRAGCSCCSLLLLVYVTVVVSRVRLNGGHDGALPDELAAGSAELNLVVVLAGGVDAQGRPHETVLRRLRAAARLHRQASKRGRALSILCNGGGTTHKPKWVDAQGYAVPEAALMARQLVELGVPYEHIYLEGYSDDTLGNAFFVRCPLASHRRGPSQRPTLSRHHCRRYRHCTESLTTNTSVERKRLT